MNNPVLTPQKNGPIPINANPQINLVANLQINRNPNPVVNTPVAVPITDDNRLPYVPIIDNAVPISGTNNTNPVAIPLSNMTPEDDIYEQEYDTGYEYMDLQEELDFNDENGDDVDNDKTDFKNVILCLYRIRTDLQTPFLEFLVERTDENPQYHLPLYTEDNADDINENTVLQNNLLRKIEFLLDNNETLETPRFLGFQTHEEPVVAFYDLSDYSVSSLFVKDGSVQWVLLNQITEENGFHLDTIVFFQKNVYIRTLYHLPTQEEVPPPVLVYHSFQKLTRTDDPVFGFPFVFTEKPLFPVEMLSTPNTDVVKTKMVEQETPPVEKSGTDDKTLGTDDIKPETDNGQKQTPLSYLNPLSTTNRSYTFILFPPSLEKTLVILKQEFQNISQELLKKYNDVFLKKVCIRFLKDGTDYWIVKSPVVAFPYLPFQPFNKKQHSVLSKSTGVSFLPEKTTSSSLTTSSNHPVANGAVGSSSFHLNLENLLNPHRITERANLVKIR